MASEAGGMANGTNNANYMNSFLSFVDSQGQDGKVEVANNMKQEVLEVKAEMFPPVAEEVPPTDHTPAEPPDSPNPNSLDPLQEDDNTNSSVATSMSDGDEGGEGSRGGHRNVARRGKKRHGPGGSSEELEGEVAQREPLRRSARSVQRYGHIEIESDSLADSDPDFHLSDSDDDPDFDPASKKTAGGQSDEDEFRPRRGRGRSRGMGTRGGIFTPPGRGRGIKRSADTNDTKNVQVSTPKRRGRPPTYVVQPLHSRNEEDEDDPAAGTDGAQDNTVTSTDEKKAPSKLSSAFNYAGSRVERQTVKLPEGPELTAEQLQMIESQFKSGDFVMAKKDMDMMEHPPIWRIDGKSLLQKFQAFEKDGKTLYRNISTYSGWTSQAKALYVLVHVTFVFQSRHDTVVELVGVKDGEEDEPPKGGGGGSGKEDSEQISEDLRSHMPSFEIYLQTLISQALDNNFLMEIYEENDDYFVERVKVIDELAEQRKKKIIEIVDWSEKFKNSLDTWPCVNVIITKNGSTCEACGKRTATKLSQLYGQPYNQQTLRSREPMPSENEAKNFEVCDRCSHISQLYSKVTHKKYDYYSQCKSTVTNMRATHPSKHTTTILRDLLANDYWIMGLFRSMCTTWIKVDRLYQEEIDDRKKLDEKTT